MAHILAILALVAATSLACSDGPPILHPNGATEFRVDVSIRLLEARAKECRTEPSPGSRPCRIRISATITNVGDETADPICHVSIVEPDGHVVSGHDMILGTLQPGQVVRRSGAMGFQNQLGGIGDRRCSLYDPRSTADFG
jgi:hypothetical protein